MLAVSRFLVLGSLMLAALTATAAEPGMDCPLAQQPYSSHTLLVDLTINPATRAILERDAPGVLKPFGDAPLPPGFATIITPEFILRPKPGSEEVLATLDRELARVPITPEAIRVRCARYDTIAPQLPAKIEHPAVLVFDKILGFRDSPSVDAATAALKAIAERRQWTLVFSDNGAVFNDRDLARFDVIVWNNVSGDALTIPQRDAFRRYMAQGGGFAGFHGSGGDLVYIWDWYADELIGARFIGHPMNPQFQSARVAVADRASPITQGLGSEWTMTEEWYSFKTSPRTTGAHVLATLDESTYSLVGFSGEDLHMGDHPIAWTRCLGKGRSFYSAIGHRPESYSEPHSVRLLEQGIAWAAGLSGAGCAR